MSKKHGGSPEFPYYTDKQKVPAGPRQDEEEGRAGDGEIGDDTQFFKDRAPAPLPPRNKEKEFQLFWRDNPELEESLAREKFEKYVLPPQQSKVPVIKSEYWTAKDGTIQEWCAECGYEKFHKVTCSKSTAALAGETRTEAGYRIEYDGDANCNELIRVSDGESIFSDCMEPEDALLTRDLKPLIDELNTLQSRIAQLERERDSFRFRLFYFDPEFHKHGSDHTTACSIWREDGQGNAEGFEGSRGPCNCGALETYERKRAETAEAALTQAQAELKEYRDADRMRKNQ